MERVERGIDMTIFVYDGKKLVTDRASFKSGICIDAATNKQYYFTYGGIDIYLAGAGLRGDILAMADWLKRELNNYNGIIDLEDFQIKDKSGYEATAERMEANDFLLIFSANGENFAYHLGARAYPIRVHAPYAGGNEDAMLVAMGAMHAGANALKAARIAVRLTCIAQSEDELDVTIL